MGAMLRFFLANGAKKFVTKYGAKALTKVKSFIKSNPEKVSKIKPTVKQKSFKTSPLAKASVEAKKYVDPNYSFKKLPFLKGKGRTKGTDISKGMNNG
jgi:hypothetical protein